MSAVLENESFQPWPWKRLGDVTQVVNGTTPKSSISDYWNGDITWVTPSDLGKLNDVYVDDSDRRISDAGFRSCGLKLVPPGSVVLSSRAPIGHLAIATIELCTNQGCKALVPGDQVDSVYLFHALRFLMEDLKSLGSGATFTEVSKTQVQDFRIPAPPLLEQERIAAKLTEQMRAFERARRASVLRLEAARALPTAWLREAFEKRAARDSDPKSVGDIAELLPSKSIASDGDTHVVAVTTACLSEAGFRPEGLKNARMWRKDADASVLKTGEILIARSNTPALVGRASVYRGQPIGVVASDLTIRAWPNESEIDGRFLSYFLSYLFQTGYWKNHAGGASGTMKKITRRQVLEKEIPVPSRAIQIVCVEWLDSQFARFPKTLSALTAEHESLDLLPAALLKTAFVGDL